MNISSRAELPADGVADVAGLAAALARIDDRGLDADSRGALAEARDIAARLAARFCAEEAPLRDRERYRRLLELAGAEAAQELLERLAEDLARVERGLMRALAAGPNPAEVRSETHVLVALAGAVGATSLQRLAEALNAAANREAAEEMTRLGAVTLEQLTRLVSFIAAEEAAGRATA
jgi:HPt (histidine-containing phosphotransfer) domain-containing protein